MSSMAESLDFDKCLELTRTASYLVECGRRPTLRPSQDQRYAEAARLYGRDAAFRQIVEAICSGLGLKVINCDDFGVILACHDPESPAVLKARDALRGRQQVEDRLLLGLSIATIAAMLYPTEEELMEVTARRRSITSNDVRERLITVAEPMCKITSAEEAGDDTGIPGETWHHVTRMSLAEHVMRVAPVHRGKAGKSKQGTLLHFIETALELLREQGFLSRSEEERGTIYSAFDRFRRHLQAHGAVSAYETVRTVLAAVAAADGKDQPGLAPEAGHEEQTPADKAEVVSEG